MKARAIETNLNVLLDIPPNALVLSDSGSVIIGKTREKLGQISKGRATNLPKRLREEDSSNECTAHHSQEDEKETQKKIEVQYALTSHRSSYCSSVTDSIITPLVIICVTQQ